MFPKLAKPITASFVGRDVYDISDKGKGDCRSIGEKQVGDDKGEISIELILSSSGPVSLGVSFSLLLDKSKNWNFELCSKNSDE